ncbi:hypothetical protein M0802_006517 [Mischocyttarus mexicanus]|nr:hypothetical protein M0802_006517 [Mischocyttarus mexicanus]
MVIVVVVVVTTIACDSDDSGSGGGGGGGGGGGALGFEKKKCNGERMRLRIAELLVWRETVCVSGSGDFASECLGHFQSKPKLVD